MKMKLFVVLFAAFQLAHSWSLQNVETPFIVGGERAEIAEFPWSLALLDLLRGGASGYICGASNIGARWAMSAAHCLHSNTPATLINLYGGSNSRISGGHLFFVDRYILHPRYSRITLDFDIALINVGADTPLSGFANVQAIALPPPCNSACCGICVAGSNVWVAGWGRIDNGSLPEFLMKVDKAVEPLAACSASWSPRTITPRMFCTTIENGRDSCNGDSGSAVVRDGIQHGVVSFGSSVCGDGSRPAVYVRVEDPDVRGWVTEIAQI